MANDDSSVTTTIGLPGALSAAGTLAGIEALKGGTKLPLSTLLTPTPLGVARPHPITLAGLAQLPGLFEPIVTQSQQAAAAAAGSVPAGPLGHSIGRLQDIGGMTQSEANALASLGGSLRPGSLGAGRPAGIRSTQLQREQSSLLGPGFVPTYPPSFGPASVPLGKPQMSLADALSKGIVQQDSTGRITISDIEKFENKINKDRIFALPEGGQRTIMDAIFAGIQRTRDYESDVGIPIGPGVSDSVAQQAQNAGEDFQGLTFDQRGIITVNKGQNKLFVGNTVINTGEGTEGRIEGNILDLIGDDNNNIVSFTPPARFSNGNLIPYGAPGYVEPVLHTLNNNTALQELFDNGYIDQGSTNRLHAKGWIVWDNAQDRWIVRGSQAERDMGPNVVVQAGASLAPPPPFGAGAIDPRLVAPPASPAGSARRQDDESVWATWARRKNKLDSLIEEQAMSPDATNKKGETFNTRIARLNEKIAGMGVSSPA